MTSRYATRSYKKFQIHVIVGADTFIERLRKVRALNCNPSDVGINNYVTKRLFFNRSNNGTKL